MSTDSAAAASALGQASPARRFLSASAMLLAVLAAWASTVFSWLLNQLTFFGDQLGRLDHVSGAVNAGVGIVLLVVAGLALRSLDAAAWLLVLTALAAGSLLVLGLLSYADYVGTSPEEDSYVDSVSEGVGLVLIFGGLPVLALVVAAVTGRSRLSPRRPPAR